jgi:hypothetical protein
MAKAAAATQRCGKMVVSAAVAAAALTPRGPHHDPGFVDPVPMGDSDAHQWASCFKAIAPYPEVHRDCWKKDCGPDQIVRYNPQTRQCECGQPTRNMTGLGGLCNALRCPEGEVPTVRYRMCICTSSGEIPPAGLHPPGNPPAPWTFFEVRQDLADLFP